jgi:hypothetical protein
MQKEAHMKKRVIILRLDHYSRIILTIIAVSLMGMLCKSFFPVSKAEAELQVSDINIAMINGQPIDIATPFRVSIAKARSIPVNIENSITLPITVEKPETFAMRIVEPEVIPVTLISPEIINANVVGAITVPVELTGPNPVPVVQTIRRVKTPQQER